MYHTSLLFLLFIISTVQGVFVVKTFFEGAGTCSSSSLLSSVQVLPLGKCIDLGFGAYAKVLLNTNNVITYDCTDPTCQTCTTIEEVDPVNVCQRVLDEDDNFIGVQNIQISASFPTQYNGHTIVMYGQSNCAGDWAEVLIDVAGSNKACNIIDGTCKSDDTSMSLFCSLPPFLTSPYKFDLGATYILERYFDSSSCNGNPGNGTILIPGACQTYLHATSRYFEIVGEQVIEYTCLSGNCTNLCSIEAVYSVGQCKSEANIFDGTQYKIITVTQGFPKSLVEHMQLTVQYDTQNCDGQPLVVKYQKKGQSCYTGCLPVLLEGSFCSGQLFFDDVAGIKHKDKEDNSMIVVGVVVGVIIVVIAAGVIGFILYRQSRNRRASHHFHPSGPLTSPLLNGEDEIY